MDQRRRLISVTNAITQKVEYHLEFISSIGDVIDEDDLKHKIGEIIENLPETRTTQFCVTIYKEVVEYDVHTDMKRVITDCERKK